jgi:hypothetical protein
MDVRMGILAEADILDVSSSVDSNRSVRSEQSSSSSSAIAMSSTEGGITTGSISIAPSPAIVSTATFSLLRLLGIVIITYNEIDEKGEEK